MTAPDSPDARVFALAKACRHEDSEVLPLDTGGKTTIPVQVVRHCRKCGSLFRKGKWEVPTLLAEIPPPPAVPTATAHAYPPHIAEAHAAIDSIFERVSARNPEGLAAVSRVFPALARATSRTEVDAALADMEHGLSSPAAAPARAATQGRPPTPPR